MGGPSLAGTWEAGDHFCCSITGAGTGGLRRLTWGSGLWAAAGSPRGLDGALLLLLVADI